MKILFTLILQKCIFYNIQNDLCWNQNSYLSEKWRNSINLYQLEQIPLKQLQDNHDIIKKKKEIESFSYYEYLEQYNKNKENYESEIEIITKDVDLVIYLGYFIKKLHQFLIKRYILKKNSLEKIICFNNQILREEVIFIDKVQEGQSVDQCRTNIKNVLIALVVKYPFLGYCQGMNYLAVILLCFTNEEVAFNLYCHLIENILPEKYYQKNGKGSGLIGFMSECYLMRNLVPLFFQDKDEVDQIQLFLEMQCPNYLLTLLINTLNIACVFHVWDLMFIENSIWVYKVKDFQLENPVVLSNIF